MKSPSSTRFKSLCVFCGSRPGHSDEYMDATEELAEIMVSRNISLVYGGGSTGIMGGIADAVLQKKGHVVGVIPEHLLHAEVAHSGLTELRVVATMHERKALMAELADGFIALPGGYGTFEELFEVVTWAQLGLHEKPIGVLNVRDYYSPLLNLVDHGILAGFIPEAHRRLILSSASLPELIEELENYKAVQTPKWVSRSSNSK